MQKAELTHVKAIVEDPWFARILMARMNWPAWCPGAKVVPALTSTVCTLICKYFVAG